MRKTNSHKATPEKAHDDAYDHCIKAYGNERYVLISRERVNEDEN